MWGNCITVIRASCPQFMNSKLMFLSTWRHTDGVYYPLMEIIGIYKWLFFIYWAITYGHTTVNMPHLVRYGQLSRVGPGSYLDGRLPGNTRCCRCLFRNSRGSCCFFSGDTALTNRAALSVPLSCLIFFLQCCFKFFFQNISSYHNDIMTKWGIRLMYFGFEHVFWKRKQGKQCVLNLIKIC